MNETTFDSNGRIVEQVVDNGDGTGTRTVYDGKGNVTSTEQVDGLPIVDIDPEHASDDPLAAEVARLGSLLEAVLADPEIAKVADIEAIRTAAESTKDDDALVLAVAKALGADPDEVRKKRDENPQWFADVVAKYGLNNGDKADGGGSISGPGAGGSGGGGAGSNSGTTGAGGAATAGTANKGGGGGGGSSATSDSHGGAGGSGIVIVRYPI